MKSKLPEGWESLKLEEVIDTQVDNRGRNPAVYLDYSDYPVIDNYLIKNERYPNMKNVNRYITEDTFNNFLRGYVNKDDVIITLVGNGIANVSMVPHSKAVIIQNTLGLRCNDSMYNKFLYYSLLYNQESIKNFDRGSSQPSIRKTDLFKYRILKPTLSEQKAIADTLSALDDKIELNNKINENLEEQAQAIFKHWFIDFEFPDENGNPYKSSGGEMVESELGMIPKGWEVIRIKDISDRINGYSYKSVDMNEESNNKLLTLKNFNKNGGYDNTHYRRIDITDRVREYHYVKDGDILLACTDLTQNAEVVGNPIMYFSTGRFCNALLSMDLVKIVPKDLNHNIYLYHVLKNRNFKEYAKNHSTGTTVLHFKKKSIDDFKMIKPSEKIIKYFTDIANNIEIMIINNYKQNQNLSQLRDTLLPKLMSGEIRIPLY